MPIPGLFKIEDGVYHLRKSSTNNYKISVSEMMCHYHNGVSCKTLAKHYGVSDQTIRNVLKKHGLLTSKQKFDRTELLKLYNEGNSVTDIATEFNVNPSTISRALKMCKIKTESSVGRPAKHVTEILEYYTQGFKLKEIAEKLNISYGTVLYHIRIHYGTLKVRTAGDSVKLTFSSIYENSYPLRNTIIY